MALPGGGGAAAYGGIEEMPCPREIELKFEMVPDDLPALMGHPLLAGLPHEDSRQKSVYFDTADGSLRRAGVALRVRETDGHFVQTVKTDGGAAGGFFDRGEWEREIAGGKPDLDRLENAVPALRLEGRASRSAIRPRFETIVDRSAWRIDDGGNEVELVLDRGEIVARRARAAIMEIELELVRGSARRLFDLAHALNRAAPLRLGVLAKSERGFRLLDGKARGIAKAGAVSLSLDMKASEGFQAIASACIRHFRLNEPLFTRERDGEALHQARVALRRLRSAMSLFKPIIEGPELAAIREELRWISGQLGPARDLDVFARKHLDPDKASPELSSLLSAQREARFDVAIAALDSERFRALMISLVQWIALGDWLLLRDEGDRPLDEFATAALDRLERKLRKRGKHLAKLEDEERHEVRIVAKKLRYASEFFASLHDGSKRRKRHAAFVSALEEMQEQLGLLNDLAIAETLSRKIADALPEAARGELLDLVAHHSHADKRCLLDAGAAAHRDFVEVRPFWR